MNYHAITDARFTFTELGQQARSWHQWATVLETQCRHILSMDDYDTMCAQYVELQGLIEYVDQQTHRVVWIADYLNGQQTCRSAIIDAVIDPLHARAQNLRATVEGVRHAVARRAVDHMGVDSVERYANGER